MYGGVIDTILEVQETHHPCQHCNKTGFNSFYVQGTYFHLMFIPTLSGGKEVYSTCTNCGKTYSLKNMPPHIQFDAREFKKKVKVPTWYNSLIIAIILFIPLFIIFSIPDYDDLVERYKNEKLQGKYILYPEKNDVYLYDTSLESGKKQWYTLLKVDSVGKDSVYLIMNNWEAETILEVDKKNTGWGFFMGIEYALAKEDIEEMYKYGTIIRVEREEFREKVWYRDGVDFFD